MGSMHLKTIKGLLIFFIIALIASGITAILQLILFYTQAGW